MELSAVGPNERPEEVQFADSLEQFSSSGDTFDLVEKYKIVTHNSYVSLRNAIVQAENLRVVGPSSSSSLQLKKQECLLLQQERNTWLLLHDLERDRESVMEEEETMKERNASDDMEVAKSQVEISTNSKFIKLSDKKTVENLISKDYVLRQHMIVVRWLEAITEDDFEYFSQEVLWLNTLSELNQRNRPQASGFRSPELADLVTRIDPDAETRELKSLHPHDKEDEERILQSIWNLLRLGKLDTAVQLCRTANMFWRAATLNGALLYHHNVLDNPYDTSVEGNELRFLWKNQCVSLSKNDRANPFERAIYGLLGGNLEPVLAVCRNYNDILWANYSVLLNAKIDENLAKHQSVFSEDLPINVLNSNINNITPPSNNNPAQIVQNKYIRSEDAIFSELRNHNDLEIRRQAHERYHIIQEKLVLGQTDELLILMSQWVSETYRDQGVLRFSCPPQLLRFGAHFVLFYFREGFPEMADNDAQLQGTTTLQVINAATNIIAAYIRHLQETNQIARIALYTSKLPASRQVETYAQFCSHIMDREQREECLLLADKASLDITAITKRVVEIIINSTTATVVSKHKTLPFFKDFESEDFDFANISVDDQVKIHAIEWLCFDPSHRAEALLQSLKLARLFLESRRLDSAHLLLYRVLPEDTVEVVEENSQPDDTIITNAIREYTAFRLLLGSHKLFRTWFAYHSSKPIAPALSPSDKGNMVAEFQYNAKLREFANQFEQWQEEEDKRATNSKVTILQILQFPGGWLCDAAEDPSVTFHLPVNQDRGRQLQALRKLYTPDLFYMLHMVLHETQQYAESLELASLVADEKNKLYALFTKDELQKFLERLRKSAIAILGKSKDDLSQTNVF